MRATSPEILSDLKFAICIPAPSSAAHRGACHLAKASLVGVLPSRTRQGDSLAFVVPGPSASPTPVWGFSSSPRRARRHPHCTSTIPLLKWTGANDPRQPMFPAKLPPDASRKITPSAQESRFEVGFAEALIAWNLSGLRVSDQLFLAFAMHQPSSDRMASPGGPVYFHQRRVLNVAPGVLYLMKQMFGWSRINRQRKRIVREDRRYLEARVRRFLSDYLSATDLQKSRYYEVVAGALAGCHPENSVSYLQNMRIAEMTAETANAVVKQRLQAEKDSYDSLEIFITDAYATAAVAYRRAAGIYVGDKQMQKLGTAAVHLLTIATSRMMAQSKDASHEAAS